MEQHKDHTRAQRRHDLARIKQRRSDYWGRSYAPDPALTPRQLGIVAKTPAICSGFCCGNPRKWFSELTHQERKLAARAFDLVGD